MWWHLFNEWQITRIYPDLKEAEKFILKGDANVGDFRFIVGFEAFYGAHLENIMKRNRYVAVNVEGYKGKDLLLDTLWNNKALVEKKYVRNDLWANMVKLLGDVYCESISDTELFYEFVLTIWKGLIHNLKNQIN